MRRSQPAGCLADASLTDDQLRKLRARTADGRIAFQDGAGLGQALDALATEAG